MAIKSSVFIATSLDGYIARADGGLDWLFGATASEDDHGYADFLATVDVLAMGRNTYEKVLSFDPWPYVGRRVVVVSSTLRRKQIPAALRASVEVHAGPPAKLLNFLEAGACHSLYVDGGKLIQSFLQAGLLDEITVTHIPVLIGAGIPLFGALESDVALEHVKTRAYDSGFVQSTYRIRRQETGR